MSAATDIFKPASTGTPYDDTALQTAITDLQTDDDADDAIHLDYGTRIGNAEGAISSLQDDSHPATPQNTAINERVKIAGDTMTGALQIEQDSTAVSANMLELNSTEANGSEQIAFNSQGTRRGYLVDHDPTSSLRLERDGGAGMVLFDDFGRFNKRMEGRQTEVADIGTTLTTKEYVDYRNRAQLIDRSAETNVNVATNVTAFNKALLADINLSLAGMYKISWSVEWSMSDTTSNAEMFINMNNSPVAVMRDEMTALEGAGATLENIGGAGTLSAGNVMRKNWAGFTIVNVTAVSNNFNLDVHSVGGGVLGIFDPRITVEWFSEP